MTEFLRTPKEDGDTYCDVQDGVIIAQIALKKEDGSFECLEVKKNLRKKDGNRFAKEKREEIIESAEKEVKALYDKKVAAAKAAAAKKK